MIARKALAEVLDGLRRQPVVVLVGPRQCGKTTLALELATQVPAIYLDLERPADIAKLAEPELFFAAVGDRLVILDEIHRVPDLFPVLRGVVDRGRREGRRTGRFLILGSASLELLRQSGETLAGRARIVPMTSLRPDEVGADPAEQERLWTRGGFPESFLAATDLDSLRWRNDFIRTYLERDVAMFGPRIPAETLGRLWTMLAHRQGAILNASDLGRTLEVSSVTVNRYLDLLVDLLLVRRLAPFAANVGKRLVRSPKVYIRDSGVVHALLGIETQLELMGHPVIGSSWEGFVIEAISNVLPFGARLYFYRTSAGAECDLVVEWPNGGRWMIEIKRTMSPRLERGWREASTDLSPSRSFVAYTGESRYPMAPGVEAISLGDLMHEVAEASG